MTHHSHLVFLDPRNFTVRYGIKTKESEIPVKFMTIYIHSIEDGEGFFDIFK